MANAKWRRYLRFWRTNVVADIDEELRFHFTERFDALVASGLRREDAMRRAEQEFGNVHAVRRGLHEIDERVHSSRRRANRLERWWQDLVYSARALRRTRGVSLTIIVTLALGIGLNATLFSLLDRIFLRLPSGIVQPREVRRLYWRSHGLGSQSVALSSFSIPVANAIRDAVKASADLAVYQFSWVHFGDDPDGVHTTVHYTGPRYFDLLGVRPAYGRFFSPEEEHLDVPVPVVIVSQGWWRRRMGGSPADAIGQKIVLQDTRYTVIGVAPRGFTGPDLNAIDVWLPLGDFPGWGDVPGQPRWYQSPTLHAFPILARPNPGVTSKRLESLATIGAERAFAAGISPRRTSIVSGPILEMRGPQEKGDSQETAISLRLGGVAFIVLLIACANVANLLIVRAVARSREFAIRAALGIDRRGLARLLLLESVLLSMTAGIAALVVANWSGTALRKLLLSNVNWPPSTFDWRVAGFTLVTALVTGLIAGLAPVIQLRRADVAHMLKTGSHSGGRPRRHLRAALVVAQSALSVVLLVGAALFVRSLHAVRGIDVGFDVQRLVFVSPFFQTHDSRTNAARLAEGLPTLASRLALVPGVEQVGVSSIVPMYALSITRVFYANGESLARSNDGLPTVMGVSPEYFAATGIRLREGRLLDRTDEADSVRVGVVNETMARQTWPHANAIGQCLRLGKPTRACVRIVGIVEDAKRIELLEAPAREFYLPAPRTGDYAANTIVVRVPPSRAAAVEIAAGREVPAVIPGAKADVLRMAKILEPKYRPWQLGALLFSIFGLLALLIAAVGIFSVVSHDVGQRRRELGVRVALGASVTDVVRLVLGGGVRVVALGVVAGVLVAIVASKLIASILYGVAPRDPAVLGGVAVVLLIVAGVASALPAWRASRADPMEALRAD